MPVIRTETFAPAALWPRSLLVALLGGSSLALLGACASYSGGGLQGVTDHALAAQGRTRRVALSVPSFLVLMEVLRCSDLVAMLRIA